MMGAHRASRPKRSLQARAVAFLARREHSRAELRAKLLSSGQAEAASDAEVDAVLDALAAKGYLSDVRFAKGLARERRNAYGKRAIVEALRAKGVAADAVDEALADADLDESAALTALWRRKFGEPPADEREKARQVRFLQSRGFALAAILKLLRAPPTE